MTRATIPGRPQIYLDTDYETKTDEVKALERAREIVAIIECSPDGGGTDRRRMPVKKIRMRSRLKRATLKPGEIDAISKAALRAGEALSFEALVTEMLDALGFADLYLDDSLVPDSFLAPHPCCDIRVWLEPRYELLEISVRAVADMTIGGTRYLQDERIGDFFVIVPEEVHVLVSRQHNPKCCAEPGDSLPRQYEGRYFYRGKLQKALAGKKFDFGASLAAAD
ncbi:MAG: hypothetical protein KDK12_10225 [Rhodobacteraceae bacterium]|nr:hypothetical protein [Paracoccaceae bacterium]